MALEQTKVRNFEQELKDKGLRVTRQRLAIMEVLSKADDHPDAEELLKRTRNLTPGVSMATLYRTLTCLEESGVIHRHAFDGGGARFETAEADHHDHIIDMDTGQVIEFQSEEIEQLQSLIAEKLGYKVVSHKLELYCKAIKPGAEISSDKNTRNEDTRSFA